MRQPSRLVLCPFVEIFIGGGISHLAGAAEPRRGRREEDQEVSEPGSIAAKR